MSSTAYAKYHSTSLSSSTESEALRIGDPEITDWIPVFTGMTRLESFASNGNDTFFVILNRKPPLSSSTEIKALRIVDPALSGFPFSRE